MWPWIWNHPLKADELPNVYTTADSDFPCPSVCIKLIVLQEKGVGPMKPSPVHNWPPTVRSKPSAHSPTTAASFILLSSILHGWSACLAKLQVFNYSNRVVFGLGFSHRFGVVFYCCVFNNERGIWRGHGALEHEACSVAPLTKAKHASVWEKWKAHAKTGYRGLC